MDSNLQVRLATPDDVRQDLMRGDIWAMRPLSVDRCAGIKRAIQRWGVPGTSALPGELMWRLRVDETVPVYVSVCQGEEPVALFNLYCRPERGVEEDILDRLGQMLVRGD